MTRVRLKTILAGPDGCLGVGAIYITTEIKAKGLVDGGFAEYIDKPKPAPKKQRPLDKHRKPK